MFLYRDHDCVKIQVVSSACVSDLSVTGFYLCFNLTSNIWAPQLWPNSLFSGGGFKEDSRTARNASEPNGIGTEPNGPQAEWSTEMHIRLQTGARRLHLLARAERQRTKEHTANSPSRDESESRSAKTLSSSTTVRRRSRSAQAQLHSHTNFITECSSIASVSRPRSTESTLIWLTQHEE